VYPILPVSLDCFCFVCLRHPEKLTIWGTQDKDKQSKNNQEKLATWGTQDEEKQSKNNAEKLVR
jgi:hypothetical protein